MGRCTLTAALLLAGLLGGARGEEDLQAARTPSVLTDAIREFAIELPLVGEGPAASPPAPPHGLVAVGADGRFRRTFTYATAKGLEEEVEEVTWGECREWVLLRELRSATRSFSRRFDLEVWTGETTLPVIVVADRRAPWMRVTRLMGALEAAGVRRFLLAASPVGGALGAPALLPLDLPRRTQPHGGHGRQRVSVSARLVAARGASEGEVQRRLDDGEGPPIALGFDITKAVRTFERRLRHFVAASEPEGEDAPPPWRVGQLRTQPDPCAAVRCEHALPMAAALLRAGLDHVSLGLERPRHCLQPPREPFASFEAYGVELRERKTRRETEKRFVDAADWLKAHQEDGGSWRHAAPGGARYDLVVTSLALLCFSQDRMDEWGTGPWFEVVHRGLGWLRDRQGEDGVFRVEGGPAGEDARLGHALATLAVTSAWNLRPDPAHRAGVAAALEALDKSGRSGNEIHAADVVTLLARHVARYTNERLSTRGEPLPWEPAPVVLVPDPRPAGWEEKASVWEVLYEVLRRGLGHASRKERDQDFVLRRLAKHLAERTPTWSEDDQGVDVLSWWLTTTALFEHGGFPWKIWNAALWEVVLRQDRQHKEGEAAGQAGSWDPVGKGAARLGRTGTTAAMELVKGIFYGYE